MARALGSEVSRRRRPTRIRVPRVLEETSEPARAGAPCSAFKKAREAAIERHLEQRFAALAPTALPFKELAVPVVSRKCKELRIPLGVDHEEWAQAGETTEERAERARAVALAK